MSEPQPTTIGSAPGHRDIYAEFESERDRRERQSDVPQISPARCLRAVVEHYRPSAMAESVAFSTAIDDGDRNFPLDDQMLGTLFGHLIERMIAVSPPYCDAKVSLELVEPGGFRAAFSDIGRGLNESELDIIFNQTDLIMGVSHTALARAQEAANSLGMKFSVRTAVETGTTVEVSWQD